MEMELEPRVKALGYKVKATSRESPAQKAVHVLDQDLRTHWSTGTNTKEWILLELDEPCLLSHLRIYNKSVLEWEIAVGLRYKPETFTKVRPRCEAPRREMMYHMNYSPCRYVRISCLRGNPIAIFFIQLIGVPVAGLEPEFQPVISHLLPQILAHKQDSHDPHLQLLQDMMNKLTAFLPQIEVDLSNFTDDAENTLRFLAMLAGPFYPILHAVRERETARSSTTVVDSELPKSHQPSALSVSSNFEPRRPRSSSPFFASSSIAFRPDVAFMLLRKAYKDADLGKVCKIASKLLQKLLESVSGQQTFIPSSSETMNVEETKKTTLANPFVLIDYSGLFGEEFQLPDDNWDSSSFNLIDIQAVEEGLLHVLYACASQPEVCQKLAENLFEFWSVVPLVQALLAALRPVWSGPDNFDESFSAWKQPYVQRALSQIVMTSSSSTHRPLLHAAAGYLCSFSQSHVKAACVMIDLCSSVLAPWIPLVVAKVDLCVELLEDFLGTIQSAQKSTAHVRCALKYILLALSGHMDDSLRKYKEVKHKILFLLELLEPFLDAAILRFRSSIAFGDVYSDIPENQKHNCEISLNIIRTAIRKSAVLPYLESEWRKGAVAPSVLLSILEPGMELPPEIDFCKSPSPPFPAVGSGDSLVRSKNQEDSDGKVDVSDATSKVDAYEDVSLFFAPPELQNIALTVTDVCTTPNEVNVADKAMDVNGKRDRIEGISDDHCPGSLDRDCGFIAEHSNFQADYYQLVNFRDCELRASEFERLALDLHSQTESTAEAHDAAIDALLLAAECYVNPFFMSKAKSKFQNQDKTGRIKGDVFGSSMKNANLETIAQLEKKRDKVVLQLLLQAAELDRDYWQKSPDSECCAYYSELSNEGVIHLSADDAQSADAVTLVRQNQALLCRFLIRKLQTAQDSMHEILLQSLLFLLESATCLSCDPRDVIITILHSAEYLSEFVTAVYRQSKEGLLHSDNGKVREVQRRWVLLQKLVVASSGCDGILKFQINLNKSYQYNKLIPPSAWMQQVSMFSSSTSPIVRFLGWMAVSRNAEQYTKERMFLASDLSELGSLLSVFADELSTDTYRKEDAPSRKRPELDEKNRSQSFRVIHPDLSRFFPNMKTQFESFGESILEAVGLQMRSLPPSLLNDVLCWFADLCLSPFPRKDSSASKVGIGGLKGHVAKNAKAVILYILEAITAEHMEAMVNEIPRLVHVLVSLCRASYCDVSFLGCILQLMRPIISYSLQKASDEVALVDDPSFSFESLCFHELFDEISKKPETEYSSYNSRSRALAMFVLASVFTDLSFKHQRDTLQSFLLWADFTAFEKTATFHDYISAFQCMVDSCKIVLVRDLTVFGAIPLQLPNFSGSGGALFSDDSLKKQTWSLHDIPFDIQPDEVSQKEKATHLSVEETNELCEKIDILINKLCPTMEQCWMLHHQLANKMTSQLAECLVYSRCLSSVIHQKDEGDGIESPTSLKSLDQFPAHWLSGLQGLGETVLMLLGSHCWHIASTMLDWLLGVPPYFPLNMIIGTICSAITNFACSAPKVSWRLQTDKWLSTFFSRGFYGFLENESPLLELFCTLLGHHEPEQRSIALKHLAKLVGQESDPDSVIGFSGPCFKLTSPGSVSALPDSVLSVLVSTTWDSVILMASSDTSLLLRTRAMALLLDFLPFAKRNQLQSFLASADTVLHGFAKLAYPSFEGPMLQLSLALIAGACLYSNDEDISLVPENLWERIETLGLSNTEGKVGDLERRTCQALCCLRDKGGEQKEVLREALSSSIVKQSDPNFVGTRDAILEVLANLTSAESYIDVFSGKMDETSPEEELEIELEIVLNEDVSQPPFNDSPDSLKDGSRLQQIKDSIRSIEKSRLREEIVARRKKKLHLRHDRQKLLEEAALREAELLQDLDRERTAELEKEIDRQRQLEIERAKTRELRHNLDLERERQSQRDLQRELEQIESGVRPSRREAPSTQTSRGGRDRFRERDSGRSSGEATGRTSNETSNNPMVVLSGGRAYSGQQPPTILQSRDRVDEYGGGAYEESCNLDGSRDSGDTGSVGDTDSLSAFDTSSQRHGSGLRGSKSRQALERRAERDGGGGGGGGRREGKWERKH